MVNVGPDAPVAQRGVRLLAERAQYAVGIVGTLLGLFFTWLTFRGFPYVTWLENTDVEFLRHLALAVYYFCWVVGSTFDIRVQREVYQNDPQLGSLPRIAVGAIVLLLVVAAALLAVSLSEHWFSILLALFIATNIFGWRVIIHRVNPVIAASEAKYRADANYFGLEQLRVVSTYLKGRWQWHRFAVMMAFALLAIAICFSTSVRQMVSEAVSFLVRDLPPPAVSRLLPVSSLLLYVVVAEAWIWGVRARVRATLNVLYRLEEQYELRPR
jgi:hypothetical protein